MRLRLLEPLLRRALRGPCALPRGSLLLVAVSGGADSTALLIGLSRVAPEQGLTLHAAHLHHGLRGAEADQDLEFVHRLCAGLGVPLSSARWNTKLRMKRRRLSGESGLRTLRREFLLHAAKRVGAVAVATAHTADDQLETVLMRLLRGTGLLGLGGMSPRRGGWIKPMLEATRADVEADLRGAGQPWRVDRSNADATHTRNRLRHEAIPALIRALDPALDPARARRGLARRVARAAREAREAERALASWVATGARRLGKNEFALDSGALASYPLAARRAALRRFWKGISGAEPGLTHDHLKAFERLLVSHRGGSRIGLPSGWSAERDRGRIRVHKASAEIAPRAIPLAVPGQLRAGGYRLEGDWTSGPGSLLSLRGKGGAEEYFAVEGLEGRLELRVAGADEKFVPFGRRNPMPLGRFLRKQGVPRGSRPWVLADEGGILWVIGVRRSARAPIKRGTRRVLRVLAEQAEHYD